MPSMNPDGWRIATDNVSEFSFYIRKVILNLDAAEPLGAVRICALKYNSLLR